MALCLGRVDFSGPGDTDSDRCLCGASTVQRGVTASFPLGPPTPLTLDKLFKDKVKLGAGGPETRGC